MARIQQFGIDPLARLERLRLVLRTDLFAPVVIQGFILLGLVAYPFIKRRVWSLYLLPVWMFAYLTWGSMSLTRYAPPAIKSRYYTPVMPFLFIVGAAATCWIWSWVVRRLRT